MSAKQRVGSIFRLRKGSIIILSQIFGLIHWAQAEIRTIQSNTAFDPNYLEHFLEPDSEEFRNISVCPKLWHLKDTLSVLKMWGYPGEEHTITTEDGYIMSLFRVIPTKENSKPVLILHGYLAAPEVFLTRGKEDLPMVLTDAGYDVWLASYRGSHYGRRHVSLTTEDEQFWDFSFHEHGVYDVPAMIDHIVQVTKTPRVSCIGHSMGNAVFMSMLAMRPEYNDKVQMFVGMTPYAVARTVMNTRRRLFIPYVLKLLSKNKNTNPTNFYRRRKINPLVGLCWSFPQLCAWAIPRIFGSPVDENYWRLIPVLLGYVPSGSSNKNFVHLLALRNANFVQYDYGTKQNLVRYNSTSPPAYNLTNIRVPVSLYYGETDLLVGIKGMEDQVRALPNVVKTIIVPKYNHVDFLLGSNTREALYTPIIKDLDNYGS